MALCESNCSGIGSLLSVGVGVGQPTRYPMLRPPTPIASRPVGLQPTDFDPWASTPWGGRYKGVDARIKSAQDDFNSFPWSPAQVSIARKFSPDRPAPGGRGLRRVGEAKPSLPGAG